MKIALPSIGSMIDEHFGHCDYFTVYTIDDGKGIVGEERVESPAGCGCKSNMAQVLAQLGVEVMLAGNMGDGAVRILNTHGIRVYRGCSGGVRETAQAWLAGKLADSGISCAQHHGGHDCSRN
jgi:predicted Fe-Mo cluster-binding NifX family protein